MEKIANSKIVFNVCDSCYSKINLKQPYVKTATEKFCDNSCKIRYINEMKEQEVYYMVDGIEYFD